jgi:amino acid transporter
MYRREPQPGIVFGAIQLFRYPIVDLSILDYCITIMYKCMVLVQPMIRLAANSKNEAEPTSETNQIRRNVLGVWTSLANGLAANAPAGVTALYFVGLAGLVGGATPLVVFLAWLIYLGMTLIVYEWSKVVASSAGWAAIQKKGLGKKFAFFGGWSYWYYYLSFTAGFGLLGFSSFAYVIFPSIGEAYPYLWIPITIAIMAETTYLMYRGVRPSSLYTLVTGLIEIFFLIATSIALIIIAGPRNSVTPFTAAPVSNDWTVILVSMIFGITTFGGTNSAIPLAEETKEPRRNVPKGLVILQLMVGFTLILSSYAQTVMYGINNMSEYATLPDPGIIVYGKFLGAVAAGILTVLVLNSFNSSTIGSQNGQTRMSYAMARDGVVFPKIFSEINKYGVPGKGILINGIINGVIAIITGLVLGPLEAGIFLITTNAFFGFLNHMLGGVGLLLYHRKNKTLNLFKHVFVPIVVFIVLATAIVYAVYPAPPAPLNYAAYVALAWVIIGVIVYAVLTRKKPQNIEKFADFSL